MGTSDRLLSYQHFSNFKFFVKSIHSSHAHSLEVLGLVVMSGTPRPSVGALRAPLAVFRDV